MGAPEAFKSTLGGQGPIYAQIAFGSLPVCFRFLDGMFSKIACLHSPTGTSSTTSTTGTGAGAQSGEHAASKPSKQTRDRNKPSKGAATKRHATDTSLSAGPARARARTSRPARPREGAAKAANARQEGQASKRETEASWLHTQCGDCEKNHTKSHVTSQH